MGDFSKYLSARQNHTRITNGHCLICGTHGRLSQDHVPPKCCTTITRIEQRHINEVLGLNPSPLKGITSTNGSKFKTICHKCNNQLGATDAEVGLAYKQLTLQVNNHFKSLTGTYPLATAPINAVNFARSMIGHLLAATSVRECATPPTESPYFDPLKRFVMGDDTALNLTHDIYYWFYPNNMHLSAKQVTFLNQGHLATLSLLSFFPIAFMVTKKNEGTFPAQAVKLTLSDTHIRLNLSLANHNYSTFPFVELKGNQMYALNDCQAIISYPVGK